MQRRLLPTAFNCSQGGTCSMTQGSNWGFCPGRHLLFYSRLTVKTVVDFIISTFYSARPGELQNSLCFSGPETCPQIGLDQPGVLWEMSMLFKPAHHCLCNGTTLVDWTKSVLPQGLHGSRLLRGLSPVLLKWRILNHVCRLQSDTLDFFYIELVRITPFSLITFIDLWNLL